RRLLLRWGDARIGSASVELALLLAALAVPLMWLGWSLFWALRVGRFVPQLRLEVPPHRLRRAGTLLILWSIFVHLLWLRGQLTTYQPVVSLISAAVPIELGFAMLLVHQVHGRATARDRLVLWGLIGLMAGI